MNEWNIDYGIGDRDYGLGGKKNTKPKPYDPKDPYGMNNLADEMKGTVSDTVIGISKDIKEFKAEIKPLYSEVKGFFDRIKAEKQLRRIRIFGQNVRCLLMQKSIKPLPKLK